MASAKDVAAYIVTKMGTLDTMKLQKLLYYSQGWYLAGEGVPLFPEEIQAWANGPVVRDVYAMHRGEFRVDTPERLGEPDRLSDAEKAVVDMVITHYGKLSGWELSQASHDEAPWKKARAENHVKDGEPSVVKISEESMQEFFSSLR